ncbi:hypothetical protein DPMN_097204 [Dreissena polymorpha]|uniref:Uncharacterized protein n=1 Tax=Dreissena polymorpha TaxID=45954 RepID=A0A9D4LBC4_DREPO|nr:hypothetical protein DPMN_097204 [Dreissena polymorpha]
MDKSLIVPLNQSPLTLSELQMWGAQRTLRKCPGRLSRTVSLFPSFPFRTPWLKLKTERQSGAQTRFDIVSPLIVPKVELTILISDHRFVFVLDKSLILFRHMKNLIECLIIW